MNASWGKRALITGHLKKHGDGRGMVEATRSAPPKGLTSQ